MPAQSDTGLTTFNGWTLRVRRAAQRPARLLLLVHGWTGDENSMWVFVRNFRPDYWAMAPRAPYAAEGGGHSWRPLHPDGGWPTFEEVSPAADSLLSLLDEYASENGLDAAQFATMGFSQGAALVATLALLHPERIGRAAIMAGFVPPGAEAAIMAHPFDAKPFFVAHGTADERVPIQYARRSVELLEQAGANVTFCEDDVGHKLSLECLRALERFFA